MDRIGWDTVTLLGALVGLVAIGLLLLDAYVHRNVDLYSCWIPEPHSWHEGCWQARPETEETQ